MLGIKIFSIVPFLDSTMYIHDTIKKRNYEKDLFSLMRWGMFLGRTTAYGKHSNLPIPETLY